MNNCFKNSMPLHYEYTDGVIVNKDCIDFLKNLNDETADVIFADPPYNIKKANWDDFKNQDQYIDWCARWIQESSRVLKKTGTMFICGFTEILSDLKKPSMDYFQKCKWLIWYYDNKANLGIDWGRSHESILCLRKSDKYIFNIDDIRIPYNAHTLKYPERLQGKSSQYSNNSLFENNTWKPNPIGAKPKDVICIPTLCNGTKEKTHHPTQKPEALLRKLILSSSNENDIIVDPFSGSGTTAVVCRQLHRQFIVNDNNQEYNDLANIRLTNVPIKTKAEWIDFDRKNEERRKKIK